MLRPRRATEDDINGNYHPWVCVMFSAKWCGPCRRIDKPAVAAAVPGCMFYTCDVDDNQTSLGYAGMQSIPAFILIKDGTFKDRKAGAGSNDDVLAWLKANGVPM